MLRSLVPTGGLIIGTGFRHGPTAIAGVAATCGELGRSPAQLSQARNTDVPTSALMQGMSLVTLADSPTRPHPR